MTTLPQHSTAEAVGRSPEGEPESLRAALKTCVDLSGIDLSQRRYSRGDIERYNPHRGQMALLDAIVWTSADFRQGVALQRVRPDEFWVPGHFPEKAMMPGVLMVEAGAQLACFLFNIRQTASKVVAFLRIEDCSFRSRVEPGDDFYLLCNEVKLGRRKFESDIQGLVNGRICFSARIHGMQLDAPAGDARA